MDDQGEFSIDYYDEVSKREFTSINSPHRGSSIEQSLTLSKMYFNLSNKTEAKNKKRFKQLLLHEIQNQETVEKDELDEVNVGNERLKDLINKYHATGVNNQ